MKKDNKSAWKNEVWNGIADLLIAIAAMGIGFGIAILFQRDSIKGIPAELFFLFGGVVVIAVIGIVVLAVHLKKKKKKSPINKTYSFHSISSPQDFLARVKEEAVSSNLRMKQVENGFDLQINSNHGGRIVYRANVSAGENSGSFIRGEIMTIPWSSKPQKKKKLFQRILSFFGYVIVSPIVVVVLLGYGIYSLFVRLFHGKNMELTNEEKLCNFMINQMICKQKED